MRELFAALYAQERLTAALEILAVHRDGIKKRLWAAAPHIICLKPRTLPRNSNIAGDAEWLITELTWLAPDERREGVALTLDRIPTTRAVAIAQRVVLLESKLRRYAADAHARDVV